MKHRLLWFLLALILTLGLIGSKILSDRAVAQAGYELNWWVFSGGSGPQSGGDVQLNATLGQPLIGGSQGGTIALSAGYWYPRGGSFQLFLPLLQN